MQHTKTHDDIETGIDLMLAQMPDYVQELVNEIAAQAGLPHWQLIGGILFEAYNNGYLSAYTLDPAWKDGFKLEESECQFCHKTFMPKRIGQKFCSNECGQGLTVIENTAKEIVEEIKEPKDAAAKPANSSSKSNTALANLSKSTPVGKTKPKAGPATDKGAGWTDPKV